MAPSDVAKKYKKLEHREHVLQKHGMYIGAIEKDAIDVWLVNESGTQMEKRTIDYIPGLFKIFDEIVANAIDHAIRQKDSENPVKNIKVTIDKDTGVISVMNDGDGIEVIKHPEHGIYIPELIFGNLLTSTNYDDDAERLVQGTNGIGCKACNIFSTWFELETVDGQRGLKYKQRFESNMSVIKKPSVTKAAASKKPYTMVTFLPDYARFGTQGLSADMYEVMRKRVYDACAVTGKEVSVSFNGSKLSIPTFEKYVDLYLGSKSDHTRVHEVISDRWEVVASYNDWGGFEQISFVNGLLTLKGGKHVDCILNQIVKKITELITKKHKDANIRPQAIKDNLVLFVKCTIVNPVFDSQTKETLITPMTKFGSKPEVSAAFITKLFKSGIEQKIMDITAIHDGKQMKKTDGKKSNIVRGIVKLEDAAWAGGQKSSQCTLILTEGDSAATIEIAGLSEVGRDRYGVFPLKGKVMNVKDATIKKVTENEEINNIKKILGLESGKIYKDTSDLRYGKLMLMTDSDSVTGDTPIVCRRHSSSVFITTMDSLVNDHMWYFVGSKEYASTPVPFEVWTDKGWTKVVHVMRHYTNKRIYRVTTPTGCVDVTEDHSLLDEAGQMIKPGQCTVGMQLLHAPFAFANATAAPDAANATAANAAPTSFFDKPNRVPRDLLQGNGSGAINRFLKTLGTCDVNVDNKLGAAELYYLVTALAGNSCSITAKDDDAFVVHIGVPGTREIVEIKDLGTSSQYVYDLETENHHFQAGVGSMIVHNTDGSHIKGLVFNLFHSMWPSLVRDPASSFMTSMLTPIIKARRRDEVINFYTLSDYEKWYATPVAKQAGWKIKYYKGLGTSTNAEAREYFKDMRQVTYKFDGEDSDKSMNLAFNKKLADERKTWLSMYNRDDILDYTQPKVTYQDFVGKELIHYSNYDLERSLPSMCDGLKISQRKIMYACFKRPSLATEEIKVAQLAGYVSETSAYHHGEASLQQAIVGLAQDFVGSNNMNLLAPNGQFGSRAHGGKDASQPRYIFTQLAVTTPLVISKDDASILKYTVDDGEVVEPEHYMPIVPMILINGAIGIGTGFSTNIPCYNPAEIIKIYKAALSKEKNTLQPAPAELTPWYRGHIGEIKAVAPGKYVSCGKWAKIGADKIHITELPVGTWTFDYKEDLETLLDKEPAFKKYENKSSDKIDIMLYFTTAVALNSLLEVEENGFTKLENVFKLVSSKGLTTTNMYAFNPAGQITKYSGPSHIMEDFYTLRLGFYEKRKDKMLTLLASNASLLENKRRFVKSVVDEVIKVHTMKKQELEAYFVSNKYNEMDGNYDYLTRIPIYNFTKDKVAELEAEVAAMKAKIAKLKSKTIHDMWLADLEALEKAM